MDGPTSTLDSRNRNDSAGATGGQGTPGLDELCKMDAYWRAANYLSVGQIYLYDNPLLHEKLTLAHVKPLVVGHWGTTPGQNFIYVHLNRVIKRDDLDMIYIAGPGHGGPALVANTYLEGSYSEIYPNVSQDEDGLKKLFTQFSFPGGISSHVAPTTPGSIHEGGELGYSLSHAFGAAFDNPESGRRLRRSATARRRPAPWPPPGTPTSSSTPIKRRSRAADPAPQWLQDQQPDRFILARIEHQELEQFLRKVAAGRPYFVEGDEPAAMHQLMAATLDKVVEDIRLHPGQKARKPNDTTRGRAGR